MSSKCRIQWIDANGKATPDKNDAVAMAHIHTSKIEVSDMNHGHVRTTYLETIANSFPICADHMAKVTNAMRYGGGGGWSFTDINSDKPYYISDHTGKPTVRETK